MGWRLCADFKLSLWISENNVGYINTKKSLQKIRKSLASRREMSIPLKPGSCLSRLYIFTYNSFVSILQYLLFVDRKEVWVGHNLPDQLYPIILSLSVYHQPKIEKAFQKLYFKKLIIKITDRVKYRVTMLLKSKVDIGLYIELVLKGVIARSAFKL